MKNNLVINPTDKFRSKSNEFINLFVDRYIFDQRESKKTNDQFFSSKLDLEYRTKNFNLSNILFYEILDIIKIELNLVLKKNFDQKFFEIIIGAWLRKFIHQFVIKYHHIIEIKKSLNIHSATIYETKNFNFFTTETHTIQQATNNNLWNSCIHSYILSGLNLNIELNLIDPPKNNFDDKNFLINTNTNKGSHNNRKSFKETILNLYGYLTNLLPNNSNTFLYNTGFNLKSEKQIELAFGQIPRLYPKKLEFNYSNFDKILREKFNFTRFVKKNINDYDKAFVEIFNLIICLLDKSLPIFVVEDFNRLIKFTDKLHFPKNPKAICTSYAFESDEPFKFYLALKKSINPKVKYFVYQHGGSYITRLDNSFNNECNTCDYFITWGDKTDIAKTNNIKFVNFKIQNKRFIENKKSEKLIILTRSMGYNSLPYDRYSEGLNEMDLIVKFCKKFNDEIKRNTIIRAHYSAKNRKSQFKKLEGFKIDYAEQDYFKVVNSAKLMLFNHDSTGLLEMFALNKPTLCIWGKGNQHQNTFVADDYELLIKAEILFDDIDKLYEHLIKVWNDPLKWWYSEKVQKNLNKFVNLYTKKPDENFVNNFKKIIKDRI